ncbi:Uncharacterized protein Adt_10100 [Abeliophyllum distichum]|uniref:Retrotransposon Copia-like N-terminal domain-containing protein n=1 Tax=Abeliophyllum distichum TaxID=126358 RepID=A0ABD1UJ28_9LAMI
MANTESTNHSASSSLLSSLLGGNYHSPFGMNLTQTPAIKLEKNNFLLWKNMIMSIIRCHNLEGFILGTKVCPPEFTAVQTAESLSNENATTTVEMTQNLEYNRWVTTDQLLMGWLYSSISTKIAMRVMGSTSLGCGVLLRKALG